ncbi:hypothetical protein [Shouchella shacheensis]|uniref:hypothetical protein n=1 Tax=Shouchella shacheensis TaxID=1649580 RepID=UPI00073FE227|nr:hypothetical protein [Shouchella shacheensis]
MREVLSRREYAEIIQQIYQESNSSSAKVIKETLRSRNIKPNSVAFAFNTRNFTQIIEESLVGVKKKRRV